MIIKLNVDIKIGERKVKYQEEREFETVDDMFDHFCDGAFGGRKFDFYLNDDFEPSVDIYD